MAALRPAHSRSFRSLSQGRAPAVLSLLAFGAGATDAFTFVALGGIFTANLTGNAILIALYDRPHYPAVAAGGCTVIAAFAAAAFLGFRFSRTMALRGQELQAMRLMLILSTACHVLVVALWRLTLHSPAMMLAMLFWSGAAMALQTVAARRDGILHGATTTYATGTMVDLLRDLSEGAERWLTSRWLPLVALPIGAAIAVALGAAHPVLMPVLPLCATALCLAIIMLPSSNRPSDHGSGTGSSA